MRIGFRLVTQYGGGTLRFTGTVNEPATVAVAGQPAAVSPGGVFDRGTPVTTGTNVIAIQATDAAGNTATASYEVSVGASGKTFAFDANGNLTADGTRTFEWDARNQLVAIGVGAARVEFGYDGLQRRVLTKEFDNGVVVANTRTVWCEALICQERDAEGTTVLREQFALGERSGATARLRVLDHLGSVVAVTNIAGLVIARYEYDPWGRRTLVTGSDVSAVGFTGHSWNGLAGGWLTRFRLYDDDLGRWLSGDPAGVDDAGSLYSYVSNRPTVWYDPEGDRPSPWLGNGPWHPPQNVKARCYQSDPCSVLRAKMWVLERMIHSHTGWDQNNAPPRGGNRHAKEIADLWIGWARCQKYYLEKRCGSLDDQTPVCGDRCQRAAQTAGAAAAAILSVIVSFCMKRPVTVP